jgi:hypothetical protein
MAGKFRKKLVKGVLLVLVMFVSSCGSAANNESSSSTVGPSTIIANGTTYQFTLTVAPDAVISGGSAVWTVHVWNSANPTGAQGLNVTFTGGGLSSAETATTDINGNAAALVGITGNAGTSISVTAIVENNGTKSLQVPVTVLP